MDGKRQVGSSSSSFTAELFGIKESPASMSTGIFASMFPAPSVVIGRNSSSSKASELWKKQPMENQTWNMNHRMQGKLASYPEGGTYNIANKERNSIYQEERAEPCHLSSSLYYGGQDIYSRSPSTQTSAAYPIFNKNEGEDDPIGNNSQGASRGNWWQGSLYY